MEGGRGEKIEEERNAEKKKMMEVKKGKGRERGRRVEKEWEK